MTVTIPAAYGTPNITVSPGTGDVLHLSSLISAALSSIKGAGTLSVTTITGSTVPSPTTTGSTTELVFNPASPTAATVPAGWDYVANAGAAGSTITAANTEIVGSSTSPGSYFISGNSTIAAQGGANTVSASGNYLVSFGPGDNVVF